jgi:atypical dual specificity phosphatase
MNDDNSLLSEIPFGFRGKIVRSPMPFSSYDRLGQVWTLYQEKRIDLVVILTEKQEYLVHSKHDLPEFYQNEGLDILHLPIQDYHAPLDKAALIDAIDFVKNRSEDGENVAVHCMAGLGRTGTFLACMAKSHCGFDGQESIDWIRKHIPGALENIEQEKFVLDF